MILDTLGIIQERLNVKLQTSLKEMGLNVHCGHIWLLMLVYENQGEIEIKELVRRLEKKKTTVSDMITTLEKKGYLIKKQSLKDKRIYLVQTTEKAELIKPNILVALEEIQCEMFKGISQQSLEETSNILLTISQNLNS